MRSDLRRFATLAATILALTCAHARRSPRPCPPVRPYVKTPALAPTDATTVAGVGATGARYQVCPDAGTYLLSRAGAREPKPFELGDLLIAVYEPHSDVGKAKVVNVNCLTPGRAPGLMLAIGTGTLRPDELARKLMAAADRVAPDATVYLEVELIPRPGPRCAPDDPACKPLPYEGRCAEETGYDPKAKRRPAGMLGHAGGSCTYDGECVIGGCGNDCGPPSIEGQEGTCEEYEFNEPIYCGCVNRRCAWFRTE